MSSWRARAQCRDTRPEVFFPRNRSDSLDEARRLCTACPVLPDCLAAAVAERDWHTFRAGMTGEERKQHAANQPQQDLKTEMVRLHGLRWKPSAIALRLGVEPALVYKILKLHRESGEAA